jgi:hypothetical protein
MSKTAVARYLSVPTPNKRLRKRAWREARELIEEGLTRERDQLATWRQKIATRHATFADRLYGADKYGRDVTQSILIPPYFGKLPAEPEHGFRFVRMGERAYLWHDGAWVALSGALMRQVESHALRVDLALACAFQETRRWSGQALRFRDHHMQVERRMDLRNAAIVGRV